MTQVEEIQQFVNLEAIKKLPTDKKRAIIDAIEDMIEHEDYSEGFDDDYEEEETEEELQILEERLQEYLKNPEDVISWEDLKNDLLTRKNG